MANGGKKESTDMTLSDWGFDGALLQSNLAMTPEERAWRHQEALDLVLELTYAGQKLGYWIKSITDDPRRK